MDEKEKIIGKVLKYTHLDGNFSVNSVKIVSIISEWYDFEGEKIYDFVTVDKNASDGFIALSTKQIHELLEKGYTNYDKYVNWVVMDEKVGNVLAGKTLTVKKETDEGEEKSYFIDHLISVLPEGYMFQLVENNGVQEEITLSEQQAIELNEDGVTVLNNALLTVKDK